MESPPPLNDAQLRELGFEQVAAPNSSGIRIIVVGCGFAGLACAIESVRKGHSVVVLEKYERVKNLGDIISFNFNAGRIFHRWGLHDRLWPLCGHADEFRIHNTRGDVVQVQPFPQSLFGAHAYNGHRGEIYDVLLAHARALGVDIRLGRRVAEIWEDAGAGAAGVVADGERIAADVVVGADGVRSTARRLVLGVDDKPKSSGYAIYRAWFDAHACGVARDPLTRFLAEDRDVLYGWIGPDVHFLASNCKNGTSVSCVLTHKDDADIDESWSFPGRKEDVLAIVKDWDPRCAAILSKAPSFVDWKLVHRDPLPTWVSAGGRLALIGDAAHPFLPTSVQGASQAVEDGVALAVALQLGGKASLPLAVRTWETLRYAAPRTDRAPPLTATPHRYQRVRSAQLLGERTRDKWHRASPADRGEAMELPRPEWLLDFDAEKHAYAAYAAAAAQLAREGDRRPALP